MKRHAQCAQDKQCPQCGAATCRWCARTDGFCAKDGTCDNHEINPTFTPEERAVIDQMDVCAPAAATQDFDLVAIKKLAALNAHKDILAQVAAGYPPLMRWRVE